MNRHPSILIKLEKNDRITYSCEVFNLTPEKGHCEECKYEKFCKKVYDGFLKLVMNAESGR